MKVLFGLAFVATMLVLSGGTGYLLADEAVSSSAPVQELTQEQVRKKLETIIIDRFNLDGGDGELAMKGLTRKSRDMDPDRVGVQFFILRKGPLVPGKESMNSSMPHEIHQTVFGLEDVPLRDVVDYICKVSGLEYKIEAGRVVLFESKRS